MNGGSVIIDLDKKKDELTYRFSALKEKSGDPVA